MKDGCCDYDDDEYRDRDIETYFGMHHRGCLCVCMIICLLEEYIV